MTSITQLINDYPYRLEVLRGGRITWEGIGVYKSLEEAESAMQRYSDFTWNRYRIIERKAA